MDSRIKKIIESAAFDCTVGAGLGEDAPEEPTAGDLAFLKFMLEREPTDEETRLFVREWHAGVQCSAQP